MLLNSRILRQFLDKREVESKKERDPCESREIEKVYFQKKNIASNLKLPTIKSVASIMK